MNGTPKSDRLLTRLKTVCIESRHKLFYNKIDKFDLSRKYEYLYLLTLDYVSN